MTNSSGRWRTTPYAAEKATKRIDAVIRNRRRPKWSARLPITGAANALANVYTVRNHPASAFDPPRSRMRNGMAGSN